MSRPPRSLHVQSMWTSPYVLSCFVTLRVKRLELTIVPVHLHEKAQLAPELAELSVTSRVPVYVEGDFAISESSAIVEYLEDAYPAPAYAPVLPSDPKQAGRLCRARVEEPGHRRVLRPRAARVPAHVVSVSR